MSRPCRDRHFRTRESKQGRDSLLRRCFWTHEKRPAPRLRFCYVFYERWRVSRRWREDMVSSSTASARCPNEKNHECIT